MTEKSIKKIKIIVNETKKSIRIDKYLTKKITKENISRNQIQKFIRLGKILVNKHIVKNNYKIKQYDNIELENSIKIPVLKKNFFEEKNITAEKININIIYEDEDIMIINKPSGIVVHPGYGNEKGTLINGIKYYNYNLSKLHRFGLVHRLDKDTSGLLVFAKNEYTQNFLLKQFYTKTIKRKYIALVWGILQNTKGSITGFIGRDPKNRKRMTILEKNKYIKNARYSITHYKVLEKFKYITYISCKLNTGRTHQIRAHFKYLGHPVFQDSIYNGKKIIKICSSKHIKFFKICYNILKRQALHAISLSFIHPNNKKCVFNCPIPEDIKTIINKLRYFFHSKVPCKRI
ncbi:RluA family pseudouridine synthase [Blattabacterium cuenoti]|uniref:RluA family pseudouridine synthase n=1 Tax=Blattabacterium cuenoti TaxID=1653831 RepID=UPI00163CC24E|nr:RluA family pseudouridine synthase [Blattabacterium cuenoti]